MFLLDRLCKVTTVMRAIQSSEPSAERKKTRMFNELQHIDQSWLKRFRRNVRAWYSKHGRDLPWRRAPDAYRVWISEIMLQQTTVVAVVPYFERFLDRFPTVQKLAAADEQEVLRYWEGLGYYSRARNIHKTARLIVQDNQGQFPEDAELLIKLPGIGRYTAGAIASFAFDRKSAIVEANTLRLHSRLLGYHGDPRSSTGQRLLWAFAETILTRHSPGRFNQALMDLGATVCRPTEPACHECPVRSCCRAFANGEQAEIPMAAKKPEITQLTDVAFAIDKDGEFLLFKRQDSERWAGLWDFPRFTIDDECRIDEFDRTAHPSRLPQKVKRRLESQLREVTDINASIERRLMEIRHTVTRYRIRLVCLQAEFQSQSKNPSANFAWVSPNQFASYPLSTTGRKLAELLTESVTSAEA